MNTLTDFQLEATEQPRATFYNVPEVRVAVVREVRTESLPVANRPELVLKHWNEMVKSAAWFDADKECFVVFMLNRKNRVTGMTLCTLGTATSSLAHPREVFRAAIVASAAAIVCCHNHPSGDPAPSAADVSVTRQLREAAKAVDIDLLDHVIIGDAKEDPCGRGFYSFREAGIL